MNHTMKTTSKITVFCCVILAAVMLTALGDFSSRTNYKMKKQAEIQLKEIAEQEVKTVQVKMKSFLEKIQVSASLAETVANPTEEELRTILKSLVEQGNFDRAAVILKDGRAYYTEDMEISRSKIKYAEKAFQGESSISDIFQSEITGEDVLSVYCPIWKDGEVTGALFGTLVVENLIDTISFSGFDGEAYTYIVQQDGQIVMQTGHENSFSPDENFFYFIENKADEASMDKKQMQAMFENRKTGFLSYRIEEEARAAYYCPAGFKDWYVVAVVPHKVMKNYVDSMNEYAFYLTIKMMAAFLVVLIIVLYWNKRVRTHIEQARMAAEKSQRKYELAMKHTGSQMFEYDGRKDCVYNISPELQKRFGLPEMVENAEKMILENRYLDEETRRNMEILLKDMAGRDAQSSIEVYGMDRRWYKIVFSTIYPYNLQQVLGTVEDITHVKEMEQQYAQEEQYCNAMLSESISGFSVDLTTGKVLSAFLGGRSRGNPDEFPVYDDVVLAKMASRIHPDYREKIQELFERKNLLQLHSEGIREVREYFMLKIEEDGEYQWAVTTTHLLNDPVSGHPVAFSYVVNVNAEREREMELEYQSERDGLTGLYNRVTITRLSEENMVESWDEQKNTVQALLIMDLDGFKEINDTYGHQMGDSVLCQIAEEMTGWFEEPHLCARLGGDEFVVYLKDMESKEAVLRTAKHFCRDVGNLFSGERKKRYTLSIGVALAEIEDTFESLYRKADLALYQAKREGKNRAVLYEEEM